MSYCNFSYFLQQSILYGGPLQFQSWKPVFAEERPNSAVLTQAQFPLNFQQELPLIENSITSSQLFFQITSQSGRCVELKQPLFPASTDDLYPCIFCVVELLELTLLGSCYFEALCKALAMLDLPQNMSWCWPTLAKQHSKTD